MPAGASCLNWETCKRDSESAKLFLMPGMCRARKSILNCKHAYSSQPDKGHNYWITQRSFINDLDQCSIISKENDALILHQMAPEEHTQHNWVKF